MDKLPYRLEDDLRTEVAAIQHPLINALIGTQLNYNDSVFLDLRTISNAKAMLTGKKYLIGNDGKDIKVVTRIPDFYTKTRDTEVNTINERVITLSLKSIVEEADKSSPFREAKYTIDLSRAIPYEDDKGYLPYASSKSHSVMQKLKYDKRDTLWTSDFEEYSIRIPFYVKHDDIDFIGNGYERDNYRLFNFNNIQDIKIQGVELEFDTIVPEDTVDDSKIEGNRYENTYIYPPYIFGLQRWKSLPIDTAYQKCVDSEHIDSATGTAAQYAIPNVLSGRHCKYMMTFAKSKNRLKTFTHADMIYDSICYRPDTSFKHLSYYEYLKLMRGGYSGTSREKDVTIGANNYYNGGEAGEGSHIQYSVDYPLPLNVTFEFGHPDSYAYESRDHEVKYDYNIVGWLVIKTYRGFKHFMPGNLANFIKRRGDAPVHDLSPETFMNMDLWANFLKAFTCKIYIPRKVPSLILKLKNGEYRFLELYMGTTTRQTNTHALHLLNSRNKKWTDPRAEQDRFGSGNVAMGNAYLRPYVRFCSIETKESWWTNGTIEYEENMSQFGRYIKSIGGFNGFLLPPERRAMHWDGENGELFNPKLYDSYMNPEEGDWK
mgnify:FL=1